MSKQGIHVAINRMHKTSYNGLSNIEYRYVKLTERKEQEDRALYGPRGFFSTAPRDISGNVNFDILSKKELDNFEMWNLNLKDINSKIERIVKKYDLNEDKILKKHLQRQNVGYGGSF